MLKDLMLTFQDLPIFEERNVDDNNLELVVNNKHIGEWGVVITRIFGEPLKAAGQDVEQSHKDMTNDYGGVTENQTLYKKDFSDVSIIIMFWPWGNNTHTTINVFLSKK